MKTAMLTNNYKPFIGGVPISAERLGRGASEPRASGDRVCTPRRGQMGGGDVDVVEIPGSLRVAGQGAGNRWQFLAIAALRSVSAKNSLTLFMYITRW